MARSFAIDGRPRHLVGMNYLSKAGGVLMWRRWDRSAVEEEVRGMAALGLNAMRAFVVWEDFMPAPDELNETQLGRLGELLDLCAGHGIGALPTLFVGHMSTSNWDVPWREGRDFFTDPWMLGREEFLVEGIVRRFKDHRAVIGWLLSNELLYYTGRTTPEAAGAWARRMISAIRRIDPDRPVGIGEGLTAGEITGGRGGFDLREVGGVVDILAPHVYRTYDTDAVRHSLYPSFVVKLAAGFGRASPREKITYIEEFGGSTLLATEESVADLYRTLMHTSYLAGSAGSLGWAYSDIVQPRLRPYYFAMHEMYFGVTRTDGSLKAPARELSRFARLIRKVEEEGWELPPDQATIIVPTIFSQHLHTAEWNKGEARKLLLESYVLARRAGLVTGFVPEPAFGDELECAPYPPFEPPTRLLLAPGLEKFIYPFWEVLLDAIRRGAILYASFFSGTGGWRGMWNPFFEQTFGGRNLLRHGAVNPAPGEIEVEFVEDFGDFTRGEKLAIRCTADRGPGSFLPFEPREAKVLARDDRGNPFLVLNRLGEGRVVLCTYPVEHYLAQEPESHSTSKTHLLYRALREFAGVRDPVEVDCPVVEKALLTQVNGDTKKTFSCPRSVLVWLINHSLGEVEGTLSVRTGEPAGIVDFETGEPAGLGFRLGPKAARVLRVSW